MTPQWQRVLAKKEDIGEKNIYLFANYFNIPVEYFTDPDFVLPPNKNLIEEKSSAEKIKSMEELLNTKNEKIIQLQEQIMRLHEQLGKK